MFNKAHAFYLFFERKKNYKYLIQRKGMFALVTRNAESEFLIRKPSQESVYVRPTLRCLESESYRWLRDDSKKIYASEMCGTVLLDN